MHCCKTGMSVENLSCSRAAFLYLSPLIPTQKKDNVKKNMFQEYFLRRAAYVTAAHSRAKDYSRKQQDVSLKGYNCEAKSKKKPRGMTGTEHKRVSHLTTSPKGEDQERKCADPNYPTIQRQPASTTSTTSGYPAVCYRKYNSIHTHSQRWSSRDHFETHAPVTDRDKMDLVTGSGSH